ncbi:MAG TPA: peptidase domain-containing ABC transporter [Flavisolibacter sp.]|nr:peptidase domain-containing ABC transporter [Flavisolibacter sp.]
MSFVFYKQPDTMDCGPTCLRMVAKHHKRSIPLQLLREKTQIGKEGVNLLGISEAAEAVGFRTKAVKIDTTTLLKEADLPAILHWNQNHFVVLYKVKGSKIFIADPANGLVHFTAKEFSEHWASDKSGNMSEGIVLLLEPSPAFYSNEFSTDENKGGLRFKNIINYVLPYKKLVLQLFIGLGIASLLQLILPFLTQSVVDTGISTGNLHFVYIVLLAQLALFAGRLAVEFVRSWILLHISIRINLSILTDFLIKLMKLPVSFFDSKHTGDILQRMNDHSRIESFLTGSSLSTLFSLVNLIVFSVVLAVFNISIFSVFLLASALYAAWVIIFLKKRKVLDYKRFEIASKEQSATIQLIQGMQEIKLNGVEKSMRWAWEGLQARLFRLSMKGLSLNQWQQAGAFFINESKNIIITFLAAKAVIDGDMTLGTMLAVQYIIGQLNSPVEQMIGFVQSWQNAKISMDRLNEIHTMEDEEPEDREFQYTLPAAFARRVVGGTAPSISQRESQQIQGSLVEETIQYATSLESDVLSNGILPFGRVREYFDTEVVFRNVSFTYSGAGNEPVLRDINLSIPKGKTTAIVGVSGSGKTTLLKLLLKFYEPQKGEIKLGGIFLSNISHKHWRSHCGVVMQESFIFSDTIARNIAVGTERVDMERLNQAVEVANVREFIESLPLGFNTKIGAEGTGISAGQKQRILIARAVYRAPEFIFFDEATNSLDAANESIIVDNLRSFFEGRTVVVVAHRLSTVKNADQIVVLNKGVISERGTHQELANLKGDYFTLIKNQLELGT